MRSFITFHTSTSYIETSKLTLLDLIDLHNDICEILQSMIPKKGSE